MSDPVTPQAQAPAGEETPSPSAETSVEASPPETPAEAPTEAAASQPAAPEVKAKQVRNASLFRAFRTRRAVRGTVEKVIKGGYEVRVGKARGFCPHSQIDVKRVDDPEQHVGQTHLFRITQLRRGGDDVVVSRRVLLEEERREEAAAVRATLVDGAIRQGRVAGLAPFGCFVDLGAGVTGLVHVSELSHGRPVAVESVVQEGQAVEVKVLRVDDESGRISLSIRQAEKDPWSGVGERFVEGQSYSGKVVRHSPHGVFVELAPGVEALAPMSELPPMKGELAEAYPAGAERNWFVLSTDERRRRISLTAQDESNGVPRALETGADVTGRVQRVERFGVFVWLGPGRVGLMPAVWSGVPRGQDLGRSFPIGDPVEVQVVEVDEAARRIRLARKGVDPVEAEKPRRPPRRDRAPRERAPRAASVATGDAAFGTSLADKLRAALNQR